MAGLVLVLIIVVLMLVVVFNGFKIVRPYEKGLLEQLGKYKSTLEPGLRFVVPGLQTVRKVDLRERVVDVPPQMIITKDNAEANVDAVIYYEVTDPVKLVYAVTNFATAVTKLAQTNLRNVIGELQLDQALTARDSVNDQLRTVLDGATDRWGARIVRVELQRIELAPDVQDSMNKQMKAERQRRADVTKAEGTKRARILEAEGQKRARILDAEGQKEAAIRTAEGEAEAIKRVADAEKYQKLTVAEGEGQAIERVFLAIHNGDPTADLIAIKYLEALQSVADGKATKIFLPLEASGTLGAIGAIAEMLKSSDMALGAATPEQ